MKKKKKKKKKLHFSTLASFCLMASQINAQTNFTKTFLLFNVSN